MESHPSELRTYAMLAKPVSSSCNLRCEYCYYRDKNLSLHVDCGRMNHEILEAFIKQNLAMHGAEAVVEFAWHGGEPTLAGLDFFKEAVGLQEKYGKGRKIRNTLQTNGTLLTDEFCRFFKEKGFLIGISIDGPAEIHDRYRKNADGEGSFEKTMAGAALLQKHGVSFNTLTALNHFNAEYPLEVYRFLRSITDYMQFLPVVECYPTKYEENESQAFAAPPGIHSFRIKHPATPFSISGEQYGRFLLSVLKEWRDFDRGKKHIQIIDSTLSVLSGANASLCTHDALCGHSGSVEANGDVYSCDRYAFTDYAIGNIMEEELSSIMEKNRRFGMHKTYGLSDDCFQCPYVKLRFGGCPKDRLSGGKNYLCEGYKMFFREILRRQRGHN